MNYKKAILHILENADDRQLRIIFFFVRSFLKKEPAAIDSANH